MPPSALEQFNSSTGGQAVDMRGVGRTLLAWVMVGVGIGIGIWLVWRIQTVLLHPDRLGMPLLPIRAEDLVMTIPSGKIVLPVAAITVVHYLVMIMLLAMVGKIAITLITQGSALVRKSDSERLPLSP
jgi:hypothetical protein